MSNPSVSNGSWGNEGYRGNGGNRGLRTGRAYRPIRSSRRSNPDDDPRFRTRWSGAGPDDRDPQALNVLMERMAKKRGWNRELSDHSVFGQWETIVGADIAAHCKPQSLDNGRLTVIAESATWATQLRLMSRQLYKKIVTAVGSRTVRELNIQGPTTTQINYGGPRRVRNR